jgi:hypothetical protein
MKTRLFIGVFVSTMAGPALAVNIAWLSLHPTDAPVAESAAQGFTASPDQGYVDLLRNNGHMVTRFQSSSPTANPAPAFASQLNNFDLIIASRQVNSGDYQDDPERAYWHGLTKPMIFMSGYVLRNNRLQFFTADDIPDINNQGPVTLTAVQPSHPIFQGITLDGSNNMQYATYPISTPSGLVQRGLSVSNSPIVAGGTVLASSGTAGSGMNGTLIGHWPTGTQVGSYTLAAPRLSFMSGSRESDPPAQVPLAGIKDLTPAGDQLFLNAVCFMATCGPPLVAGDTNGNGVGGEFPADFDPIRNNCQKTVTSRAQGDLVVNGRVDFDDFRQWKNAHLGMGGSLEGLDLSFANVPEPTTIGLASVAVCGVVACARRRRASR